MSATGRGCIGDIEATESTMPNELTREELGFGVDAVQTLLPALEEASAKDEADQLDE